MHDSFLVVVYHLWFAGDRGQAGPVGKHISCQFQELKWDSLGNAMRFFCFYVLNTYIIGHFRSHSHVSQSLAALLQKQI